MFRSQLCLALLTLLAIGLRPISALLVIQMKIPAYQCVEACYESLSEVTFGDIKSKKVSLKDQCSSTYFTTSLALCSQNYCIPENQLKGWEYYQDQCNKSNVTLKDQNQVLLKINDTVKTKTIDIFEKNKKGFNQTVLIDQRSFDAGYKTLYAEWQKVAFSHAFGFAVYIFLGIAVVIGVINRLISLSFYRRHISSSLEDTNSPARTNDQSISTRSYTWWRKHITMPALFGYQHSQPWGWVTIPTRLQSVLIFLFIAIQIVFTCVGYELFDDNLSDPIDKQSQLLDLLQYRTGVMCVYNLPLLWLLAGRNDVVLWLTGWSFSSVNLWHRWIARCAVAQAFIHGVVYSIDKRNDLTNRFLHRMYWTTGIFALICFILLVVLSIKPFRARWYEFFLVTHIILAMLSLILLYFHLTHMRGRFDPYVYACGAVWGFDRVIRLLRVFVLTHKALSKDGNNTAAVMSDNDSGLVRLSIQTSIKITPKAGQYYFLYKPFSMKPWENHPFTVASWEINEKSNSTTLHFLVAPQNGTTKKWRKSILKKPNRTDNIRLLLEGPYGHKHPIENYENILLVAGGSGITSMLAYIHTFKHHLNDLHNVRTKSMNLVWVVKNIPYTNDVLEHELKEFMQTNKEKEVIKGIKVNIQLYVTREGDVSPRTLVESTFSSQSSPSSSSTPNISRSNSVSNENGSSPQTVANSIMSEKISGDLDEIPLSKAEYNNEKGGLSSNSQSGLTIHSGRPKMQDLLNTAVNELVGNDKLAISACGPAIMTDDMRKAVCNVYGTEEGKVNGKTLEYFEELFSW
ncbi:uncharacterized protein L201_005868 [Kwoniella dendrophila CBS 6074]|uniref:FAD-binding FR-type domain-containing protein n=1 Tax=Kwoniella dendrophila CBS 6074 TaxID=1295534 RepID=A0AAX4K269_9TREE